MNFKSTIFFLGCALAFFCCFPKHPDRFLEYVWVDGISDSSAVIAFKLDKEATVRVVVRT